MHTLKPCCASPASKNVGTKEALPTRSRVTTSVTPFIPIAVGSTLRCSVCIVFHSSYQLRLDGINEGIFEGWSQSTVRMEAGVQGLPAPGRGAHGTGAEIQAARA